MNLKNYIIFIREQEIVKFTAGGDGVSEDVFLPDAFFKSAIRKIPAIPKSVTGAK